MSIVGLLTLSAPLSAQTMNSAINVATYCSTRGTLDETCFRNALATVPAGAQATLQVTGGKYQITSLKIDTPNVTLKCLPGAILQPTASSDGIRINANNVALDGCTLDMQSATRDPGVIATRVSGFSFKNGSIIHIRNQPGLQLDQTSNDVIDHNYFSTTGSGDAVMAYGPTSNIRITNNFGTAANDVVSGKNANGPSSGVYFIGNTLQPTPNSTILTTGDFTDGFGSVSPITNIVVTGNTCNIVAATSSTAPFGCYSLVGSSDLTFSGNIMNAAGQYVEDSLLELGAARSTISGNVFNEGNDPGAQAYDGIIIYSSNVTLSKNTFVGSSAYGDPIHIYTQTNASNISITGGSINIGNSFGAQITRQTPGTGYSGIGTCSVNGGTYTARARCTATVTRSGGVIFAITYAGQYTVAPTSITTSLNTSGTPATALVEEAKHQAIGAACNQRRIPIRVTGIAGPGPTGPVTSVSISGYPGPNAPVGGGFNKATGAIVEGGSGTGLKLDILSVDSLGGITSLGVTARNAGSGYRVGDTVYYPVSGSQTAAKLAGLEIGGGLIISGAVHQGIAIQGFQGTKCPTSATLGDVTISGPSDATPIITGVYSENSTVKAGNIRFSHVANHSAGSSHF